MEAVASKHQKPCANPHLGCSLGRWRGRTRGSKDIDCHQFVEAMLKQWHYIPTNSPIVLSSPVTTNPHHSNHPMSNTTNPPLNPVWVTSATLELIDLQWQQVVLKLEGLSNRRSSSLLGVIFQLDFLFF